MSIQMRIVLLILLAGAPLASKAGQWSLPQLMESMAQVSSHQSRFIETKTIAILKTPMESSGTLAYRRPSFVEKHVLSPQNETLTVDGDELTLENNGTKKKRSIRLRNNLPVWAFVEGIRATLAGDLKTLQRFYEIRLEGTQARWVLSLTPADESMRQMVQAIRIEGTDNRMMIVDVMEAGGDRSVMAIKHD
jgi:outer membrane lipoprotein-sorting protein